MAFNSSRPGGPLGGRGDPRWTSPPARAERRRSCSRASQSRQAAPRSSPRSPPAGREAPGTGVWNWSPRPGFRRLPGDTGRTPRGPDAVIARSADGSSAFDTTRVSFPGSGAGSTSTGCTRSRGAVSGVSSSTCSAVKSLGVPNPVGCSQSMPTSRLAAIASSRANRLKSGSAQALATSRAPDTGPICSTNSV